MKYLIENLEQRLYRWCLLEYEHISETVGKDNLIFTNVKTKIQRDKLSKLGKVYKESIKQLTYSEFKDKKLALLDADTEKALSPKDSEEFDILVFGGILGDNPPRQRTKKELGSLNLPLRNLGNKQMPTDTAVCVAKKIIGGTPINNLTFKDEIEIDIKEGESIILPFRFLVEDGKPFISKKLLKYIKAKKGF